MDSRIVQLVTKTKCIPSSRSNLDEKKRVGTKLDFHGGGNYPPLPSNEAGSLRRLTGLVKKLRSQGMIECYDQVIQEQIKTRIVES